MPRILPLNSSDSHDADVSNEPHKMERGSEQGIAIAELRRAVAMRSIGIRLRQRY
jgi:hypothetical protein